LEEVHAVKTIHGWGMTETSSCGLLNTPDNWQDMSVEDRGIALGKQGRPPYPVNVKIVMANGEEAPWDGKTFGNLHVSGPTVTHHYFNGEGIKCAKDGWLDTGDIAVIDSNGHVQIVDRDKDVIKSGGEWISSIALENIATSHPDILEAAVIGARHPRWDERPLLIVVSRPGRQPSPADLLAHFEGKVAKWWIPDDVLFVESLPRQATGKISKAQLREDFAEHLMDRNADR
jgi:fatty-acyl-CoA synthase